MYDIWDLLHELFGVQNPPAGHDKPPCCDTGYPHIEAAELEDFLRRLKRFNRGR